MNPTDQPTHSPAAPTAFERQMQRLIGSTLRIGVTLACLIAFVGGVVYLWQHGSDPLPDYRHFAYDNPP